MSNHPYTSYQSRRTDSTATDSETTEQTTCPECDGATATSHAELVCTDCGLVLNDEQIDRGPEWRAFTTGEHNKRSRVGAPTTNLMHDKGLSATIDWRNKDGYGNALSSKKRRQMSRLRTWDKRFRTDDSKERGLKFALGEIDRMASALGLPKATREIASVIFRQSHNNNLVPGRSLEGVASASLYAAARQEQLPRSLDELTTVSRVDRKSIQRTYTYISKELGLAIPTAHAQQYLPRFSAELDLSDQTEQMARKLLDTYYETGRASGKTATGLSAASIYAASLTTNQTYTQQEIGDVCDVTEVTIRNHYQELLDEYAEHGEGSLSTPA